MCILLTIIQATWANSPETGKRGLRRQATPQAPEQTHGTTQSKSGSVNHPCSTVAHAPRITAARKSWRNSFKRSSVLLQFFISGSFYKLWIGFTDLTEHVTSAGSKFQIKNTELPVHA